MHSGGSLPLVGRKDPYAYNETLTDCLYYEYRFGLKSIQGTVQTSGYWYVDVYAYEGPSSYSLTVTLGPGSADTIQSSP